MREIIVTDDLNRYEILNQIDDFYLAKDKLYEGKRGNIVVVYAYDGGYQYHGIYLDDLLDFDVEKYVNEFWERVFTRVGNDITKTRPYSNNFANIFKGGK